MENLDKQKILYVILQLEEQLIICLLNYYKYIVYLDLENYWEKEHLELLKNVYLKYSLNIMLSNKLIKKKEN